MIAPALTDLDELVLLCRDEKARSYISESVASYRAGAFRAAVVATWIGVCFDIIDKLRELSLSGDKEAELHSTELEKIRASGDVSSALKFERGLLELARDKFEFISHLEFIDLERLQADRNRCAHPSLASDSQFYTPSAELVRAHLHAAVHHLLQHPPVQGKYALARLIKEFESEYFPGEEKKIAELYAVGPLRRPRESLVRNFAILLLKKILSETPDSDIYKARSALAVVLKMHRASVEKVFKERLNPIVSDLSDARLGVVVKFLEKFPENWAILNAGVQLRLDEFTKKLPTSSFVDFDFLLRFDPLKTSAKWRVKFATLAELTDDVYFDLPEEIGDRLIQIYLGAKSYDQANDTAKHLGIYAGDFTEAQVKKIFEGAAKNTEILGSYGFDGFIKKLRTSRRVGTKVDTLLQATGLDQFVSED